MRWLLIMFGSLIPCLTLAAAPVLDERPAEEQQWGYRPAAGSVSATNPPGFCWRPQKDIVAWEPACRSGRAGDLQVESDGHVVARQ
jgi:hypothetical protein